MAGGSAHSQEDLVLGLAAGLSPRLQYLFAALLAEQLSVCAESAFPAGLPTRGIGYGHVSDALDGVFERERGLAEPNVALAKESATWRPMKDGVVEGGVGASLGFYVAEVTSRLAFAPLDRSCLSEVDLAWSALESVLYVPPASDELMLRDLYGPPDEERNGALVLAFEWQRDVLDSWSQGAVSEVDDLRSSGRRVAQRCAELAHQKLVRW